MAEETNEKENNVNLSDDGIDQIFVSF